MFLNQEGVRYNGQNVRISLSFPSIKLGSWLLTLLSLICAVFLLHQLTISFCKIPQKQDSKCLILGFTSIFENAKFKLFLIYVKESNGLSRSENSYKVKYIVSIYLKKEWKKQKEAYFVACSQSSKPQSHEEASEKSLQVMTAHADGNFPLWFFALWPRNRN